MSMSPQLIFDSALLLEQLLRAVKESMWTQSWTERKLSCSAASISTKRPLSYPATIVPCFRKSPVLALARFFSKTITCFYRIRPHGLVRLPVFPNNTATTGGNGQRPQRHESHTRPDARTLGTSQV